MLCTELSFWSDGTISTSGLPVQPRYYTTTVVTAVELHSELSQCSTIPTTVELTEDIL